MTNLIATRIIDEVATLTGVPTGDMTGTGQKRSVSRARFLVMGLLRANTLMSPYEIGTAMGRDRTTCLHAFQQYDRLLETDTTFRAIRDTVVRNLNGLLVTTKDKGGDIPRVTLPNEIVAAVSLASGVSLDDMIGGNRNREASTARQVAMLLLREMTPLSFPEIARVTGAASHATVMEAVKQTTRSEAFVKVEKRAREVLGFVGKIPQK